MTMLSTNSTQKHNSGGLVSIVIPVYNVRPYLQECMESVVNQTYRDLEIILVDDGSTDGSGAMCDGFAAKDKRIQVLHIENSGLSIARNNGMEAATGEFLCFVDSDDYIALDTVQLARDCLTAEGSTAVYIPGAATVKGDQVIPWPATQFPTPEKTKEAGLMRLDVGACHYFCRRQVIVDNQLQFYPGILHEDELFSFRLLCGCSSISVLQKGCYYRRIRPGSIMTTQKTIRNFLGYATICEELIRLYPRQIQEIKSFTIAKLNSMCGAAFAAYRWMSRGDQIEAKARYFQLCQALRKARLGGLSWKYTLIARLPRTGKLYQDMRSFLLRRKSD